MELEYKSKIAKIVSINGERILEIAGKGQRISIPLSTSKPPSNGLFLGEALLDADVSRAHNILEIGAGKYAPASFVLLSRFPAAVIDGVEIDSDDAESLKEIVASNNVGNRFKVFCGDMFDPVASKKYDLIVSNIAQMPLAPGAEPSSHDHGGEDGWKYLDMIVKNGCKHLAKNGLLALMAFDFLGIAQRNNPEIPCLEERLQKNGFNIISTKHYLRKVRKEGETFKAIKYILSLYPKMDVFDGASRPLKSKEAILDRSFSLKFCFVLAKKI
jgi:methylase of polypeptide subunit release factors